MGRKAINTSGEEKKMRPAITPEAKENQMISLAMDLAEKRLRNGTASSQEITYFLKLGSIRSQTELEKIKLENEMIKAKTSVLNSSENSEKLYSEAIKSFQTYAGAGNDDTTNEY